MTAFIEGILIGEKLIIRRGLFDYIGRNNNNYERAKEGFPTSYGLVIANMCFKRRDAQLITNKNGLTALQQIFSYQEGTPSLT